jgi:hypothetical protein
MLLCCNLTFFLSVGSWIDKLYDLFQLSGKAQFNAKGKKTARNTKYNLWNLL